MEHLCLINFSLSIWTAEVAWLCTPQLGFTQNKPNTTSAVPFGLHLTCCLNALGLRWKDPFYFRPFLWEIYFKLISKFPFENFRFHLIIVKSANILDLFKVSQKSWAMIGQDIPPNCIWTNLKLKKCQRNA